MQHVGIISAFYLPGGEARGDRVIEGLLCYRFLEMISTHAVTMNYSKHANKISITESFTEFYFFISFWGTIFWHNIAEKYFVIWYSAKYSSMLNVGLPFIYTCISEVSVNSNVLYFPLSFWQILLQLIYAL